jgi:hypothetical protein
MNKEYVSSSEDILNTIMNEMKVFEIYANHVIYLKQ